MLAERRPHAGIELALHAEGGGRPDRRAAFDDDAARTRGIGFVYDQAAPIGEVILGAPYSQALEVTFHGRAAHAGMYPEEGRSAIAAAARAIADLRLGRVDEDSTANVGVIEGGTAANIVPERCTFIAEARSHDEAKLADLVQEMLDGDRVRGRARRVRGRGRGRARATAATASGATTRSCALAADALARAGLRAELRPHRRRAPTRTSSTSAACSASTSRTG